MSLNRDCTVYRLPIENNFIDSVKTGKIQQISSEVDGHIHECMDYSPS